ncbi:unnamed protein product [Amoebophrya sp. A120]|nr:unnamed protein product [Amoebophrya sp. A120]|eukprot:GSA120T00022755001.1
MEEDFIKFGADEWGCEPDISLEQDIFPESLVRELIMIAKVTGVPGYRDNVLSTTFPSAPRWALPALIRARRICREQVEKHYPIMPIGGQPKKEKKNTGPVNPLARGRAQQTYKNIAMHLMNKQEQEKAAMSAAAALASAPIKRVPVAGKIAIPEAPALAEPDASGEDGSSSAEAFSHEGLIANCGKKSGSSCQTNEAFSREAMLNNANTDNAAGSSAPATENSNQAQNDAADHQHQANGHAMVEKKDEAVLASSGAANEQPQTMQQTEQISGMKTEESNKRLSAGGLASMDARPTQQGLGIPGAAPQLGAVGGGIGTPTGGALFPAANKGAMMQAGLGIPGSNIKGMQQGLGIPGVGMPGMQQGLGIPGVGMPGMQQGLGIPGMAAAGKMNMNMMQQQFGAGTMPMRGMGMATGNMQPGMMGGMGMAAGTSTMNMNKGNSMMMNNMNMQQMQMFGAPAPAAGGAQTMKGKNQKMMMQMRRTPAGQAAAMQQLQQVVPVQRPADPLAPLRPPGLGEAPSRAPRPGMISDIYFVECTALLTWMKSARIDEHVDNGPSDHLRKRFVSCVVWLNDQEPTEEEKAEKARKEKERAEREKELRDRDRDRRRRRGSRGRRSPPPREKDRKVGGSKDARKAKDEGDKEGNNEKNDKETEKTKKQEDGEDSKGKDEQGDIDMKADANVESDGSTKKQKVNFQKATFQGGDFMIENSRAPRDADPASKWHRIRPKKNLGGFFRATKKHKVAEVTKGPRMSFLVWFTRDIGCSEDYKLANSHKHTNIFDNDAVDDSEDESVKEARFEEVEEAVTLQPGQDVDDVKLMPEVTSTVGQRGRTEIFGLGPHERCDFPGFDGEIMTEQRRLEQAEEAWAEFVDAGGAQEIQQLCVSKAGAPAASPETENDRNDEAATTGVPVLGGPAALAAAGVAQLVPHDAANKEQPQASDESKPFEPTASGVDVSLPPSMAFEAGLEDGSVMFMKSDNMDNWKIKPDDEGKKDDGWWIGGGKCVLDKAAADRLVRAQIAAREAETRDRDERFALYNDGNKRDGAARSRGRGRDNSRSRRRDRERDREQRDRERGRDRGDRDRAPERRDETSRTRGRDRDRRDHHVDQRRDRDRDRAPVGGGRDDPGRRDRDRDTTKKAYDEATSKRGTDRDRDRKGGYDDRDRRDHKKEDEAAKRDRDDRYDSAEKRDRDAKDIWAKHDDHRDRKKEKQDNEDWKKEKREGGGRRFEVEDDHADAKNKKRGRDHVDNSGNHRSRSRGKKDKDAVKPADKRDKKDEHDLRGGDRDKSTGRNKREAKTQDKGDEKKKRAFSIQVSSEEDDQNAPSSKNIKNTAGNTKKTTDDKGDPATASAGKKRTRDETGDINASTADDDKNDRRRGRGTDRGGNKKDQEPTPVGRGGGRGETDNDKAAPPSKKTFRSATSANAIPLGGGTGTSANAIPLGGGSAKHGNKNKEKLKGTSANAIPLGSGGANKITSDLGTTGRGGRDDKKVRGKVDQHNKATSRERGTKDRDAGKQAQGREVGQSARAASGQRGRRETERDDKRVNEGKAQADKWANEWNNRRSPGRGDKNKDKDDRRRDDDPTYGAAYKGKKESAPSTYNYKQAADRQHDKEPTRKRGEYNDKGRGLRSDALLDDDDDNYYGAKMRTSGQEREEPDRRGRDTKVKDDGAAGRERTKNKDLAYNNDYKDDRGYDAKTSTRGRDGVRRDHRDRQEKPEEQEKDSRDGGWRKSKKEATAGTRAAAASDRNTTGGRREGGGRRGDESRGRERAKVDKGNAKNKATEDAQPASRGRERDRDVVVRSSVGAYVPAEQPFRSSRSSSIPSVVPSDISDPALDKGERSDPSPAPVLIVAAESKNTKGTSRVIDLQPNPRAKQMQIAAAAEQREKTKTSKDTATENEKTLGKKEKKKKRDKAESDDSLEEVVPASKKKKKDKKEKKDKSKKDKIGTFDPDLLLASGTTPARTTSRVCCSRGIEQVHQPTGKTKMKSDEAAARPGAPSIENENCTDPIGTFDPDSLMNPFGGLDSNMHANDDSDEEQFFGMKGGGKPSFPMPGGLDEDNFGGPDMELPQFSDPSLMMGDHVSSQQVSDMMNGKGGGDVMFFGGKEGAIMSNPGEDPFAPSSSPEVAPAAAPGGDTMPPALTPTSAKAASKYGGVPPPPYNGVVPPGGKPDSKNALPFPGGKNKMMTQQQPGGVPGMMGPAGGPNNASGAFAPGMMMNSGKMKGGGAAPGFPQNNMMMGNNKMNMNMMKNAGGYQPGFDNIKNNTFINKNKGGGKMMKNNFNNYNPNLMMKGPAMNNNKNNFMNSSNFAGMNAMNNMGMNSTNAMLNMNQQPMMAGDTSTTMNPAAFNPIIAPKSASRVMLAPQAKAKAASAAVLPNSASPSPATGPTGDPPAPGGGPADALVDLSTPLPPLEADPASTPAQSPSPAESAEVVHQEMVEGSASGGADDNSTAEVLEEAAPKPDANGSGAPQQEDSAEEPQALDEAGTKQEAVFGSTSPVDVADAPAGGDSSAPALTDDLVTDENGRGGQQATASASAAASSSAPSAPAPVQPGPVPAAISKATPPPASFAKSASVGKSSAPVLLAAPPALKKSAPPAVATTTTPTAAAAAATPAGEEGFSPPGRTSVPAKAASPGVGVSGSATMATTGAVLVPATSKARPGTAATPGGAGAATSRGVEMTAQQDQTPAAGDEGGPQLANNNVVTDTGSSTAAALVVVQEGETRRVIRTIRKRVQRWEKEDPAFRDFREKRIQEFEAVYRQKIQLGQEL